MVVLFQRPKLYFHYFVITKYIFKANRIFQYYCRKENKIKLIDDRLKFDKYFY